MWGGLTGNVQDLLRVHKCTGFVTSNDCDDSSRFDNEFEHNLISLHELNMKYPSSTPENRTTVSIAILLKIEKPITLAH